MNKEKLKLLDVMMKDLNQKEDLYKPGNYWKYYEENLIKQIKNNSLEELRKWNGGAGVGNIQSFGGGEMELQRYFRENFHPFEERFKIFDDNFFIKKYNGFINKISKYIPLISFFSFRISIARKIFFDKIKYEFNLLYELIENLDKDLLISHDSEFGSPIGFYRENKFYTSHFLKSLLHIHFIKQNTNFDKINNIIELGAGIGLLGAAFLKLKKNIKYFIIDIPPALFISEYYLKSLNYKVFGYEDLLNSKNDNINFDSYQVICIPTWRIDLLKNIRTDLFINIHSFQEMEKEQTLNYLDKISQNAPNYIFLLNAINGHFKTNKIGTFGVLNPTTMYDCERSLQKNFNIKKKIIYNNNKNYKIIFEKNI